MRRLCFVILSCFLLTLIISNCSSSRSTNEKSDYNNDNDKTSNTASSIIVCGVDGMVYIFNAWNGHLRGLFSSGSALVTANQNDDERTSGKQRIVPGLDGHIYTFHSGSDDNDYYFRHDDDIDDEDEDDNYDENMHLKVLPYSVKELIESPEILCKLRKKKKYKSNSYMNEEEEDDDDDCGIVTGSKQSTIFALDILSGSVEWVQQPSSFKLSTNLQNNQNAIIVPPKQQHQSSKNKQGRTTASKNGKTKNPNVLLLQREDYFIHQVNIHKGIEDWNVTVSNFQALDMFPSGSKKNKMRAGENLLETKYDRDEKSTSLSTYLGDWSQPKQKYHLSMILNGNSRQQQKKRGFHSFEDRKKRRNSDVLFFPSIAFGRVSILLLFIVLDSCKIMQIKSFPLFLGWE